MRTKTSPRDAAGDGHRPASFAGKLLYNLRLQNKRLASADFSACVALQARLSSCDLSRAELARSDWSGATLRLCRLDRVNAAGAVFKGAKIEDCSAPAADLSGTDMSHTGLTDSDFSRADLAGADLSGARGESVDFSGADLRDARLVGCDLPDADFRGTDLRGADLTGGRFASADFRGARLEEARTEGCVFAQALFDNTATPQGSDFEAMILRLQESDLAERLSQATGLPADVRSRLEIAFRAASADPSALLGEAFTFAKACGDATGGPAPEARLTQALAASPRIAGFLASAKLDPSVLTGLGTGSLLSPDLAAAFLGPMAKALGLPPDAAPEAMIDALMGPGGPLATGVDRGGQRR